MLAVTEFFDTAVKAAPSVQEFLVVTGGDLPKGNEHKNTQVIHSNENSTFTYLSNLVIQIREIKSGTCKENVYYKHLDSN